MKKRFEDAQIGDLVYSRVHNKGKIKCINNDYILCVFNSESKWDREQLYTLDGRPAGYACEENVLFYREGISNYLTERPKRKVPWDKVPVDTKVLVCTAINNTTKVKRYFSTYKNGLSESYFCYNAGATSWSNTDSNTINWSYCELAEEINIEGITYYPGDN